MDTAYRVHPLRPGDPERLGDYLLTGLLGVGGMGVVYLAEDRDGAFVAVKLIHASLSDDPEFRDRFRSEVERARQVPSFCTAEVLDADLDHRPPYLVVEFVDGPSLGEVVEQRGPLRSAGLHSLAVGVATALVGIHGAGVIHRDLKPDNVLLAPGSPKVIDFGIARALEATSQLTRADQMVGTVAYMAPERFSSGSGVVVSAAADVFAWGCVVAFAGTGRTPFAGDSPPATAARILTQAPVLEGLPQPLRAVVGLALAKDPRDRPSARELLDMLLGDRPVPRPVAAPPAPGGRKLVTALAALLIVAGLTIVGLVVAATRDLRPATSSPQAAANSTPVPSPPARSPSPPSAPPLTRPATPAGSPTPAKAVPNPGRRNLALHRPVSASSSEGAAWGPENAVDGDRDTRWSSGFSDPQWLTVDLGGRRLLSEIRLSWEHAYAESYRVEISTDGRRWKQLYATADGWGGDLTIDAEQTPGRYVRVYGTRRSSRYGYSLFELEVR